MKANNVLPASTSPAPPRDAATGAENRRILVVDDNRDIHDDYRAVLAGNPSADSELDALDSELFGETRDSGPEKFELDSAFQGKEGFDMVKAACEAGKPYAVAFVDVRMPPGWDGVETAKKMLAVDNDLSIVICSAYSDHSWEDMSDAFGNTDRVLILKKPYDAVEVRQLANALCCRWSLVQFATLKAEELERRVREQTQRLVEANDRLIAEAQEKELMQQELRLAQKLEAVGQLAAGIAHEINTPVQFVGDNLAFLSGAWADLQAIVDDWHALGEAVDGNEHGAMLANIRSAESNIGLEDLREEVPQAFEESVNGVKRIAKIVRSMKEFAHPGGNEMSLQNVNEIIQRTLTVATNEYKYVADVKTELGDLPQVPCNAGDIGQVLLNLIVNAAHAIGEVASEGERGTIAITTALETPDTLLISISDTGPGIPDEIRERIFDPFFTTKDVGKGTGQGLAIARRVAEAHRGSLSLETKVGEGTTFYLRLPVTGSG